MKTIKLLLSILTVLTFTSCEDVVQVKLDAGAPMITIDAFVNDMRQAQTIRLTYSDNYFSQKPNNPIGGATVVVKDVTSGQSYNFIDNSNGNYVFNVTSMDTIGRVGHTYALTVTHQGNVYSAITSMYRTTPIDSLIVEYKAAGTFVTKAGYKFSFFGIDPVGPVPDYFWIKSFRNGVFYNKGIDINITEDGANGAGSDGLIFIPPIANGITPRGERFDKFDMCRVEIHSLSEQAYNFLSQVQTQTTNSGLFATTPENVKTNITTTSTVKVVGWFNMSAVNWKQQIAQ